MKIRHNSPGKSARVNSLREQQIATGFTWGGWVFDIDHRSLAFISGRALRLTLDSDATEVQWRTKDNQIAVLSREDFMAFALAVDAHVESLYQQSWAAKDAPP